MGVFVVLGRSKRRLMTYLWKNWLKMPPLGSWSDMLARRAALASEPRFCSCRLAKAGMKPELWWWWLVSKTEGRGRGECTRRRVVLVGLGCWGVSEFMLAVLMRIMDGSNDV